jgi:hypothetical protein
MYLSVLMFGLCVMCMLVLLPNCLDFSKLNTDTHIFLNALLF